MALSIDGEIIGFQPTSRVAVNNWASNPLAKVLYKGKKLSPGKLLVYNSVPLCVSLHFLKNFPFDLILPGLVEPSVKIPQPDKIILIELLMSVNPNSWFVLARPSQ